MTANRLLIAAGTLIAGEACGFALGPFAPIWPWIAGGVGFGLLVAYGWEIRGVFLPTMFAVGVVLAARTETARLHILDSVRYVTPPPPLKVRVESPVKCWRMKRRKGLSADFLSHIGPIKVKVILPLQGNSPVPAEGETWLCRGRLTCKQERTNRFAQHTLWIAEANHARCVEPAPSATVRRTALGRLLGRQVEIGLGWSAEIAALNRAILLGQRAGLSRTQRQTFADAGTIHVFAISGLHVMLIAFVVNGLLARLDVPLQARRLITVPIVAAYVLLVGLRPSTVRAALMLALYSLAPIFKRRPNARTAWALTAILVYGISPERLFDLGCMLSFAVMLGIVFWVERMRDFMPRVEIGTWWQKLLGSLGVSFAAWVAGVPICAQTFGQFSLGGLLANTVVIACACWLVRFGVFGLMASFLCVPLAAIANNLAASCTSAMALVSKLVASLPFAVVSTPHWTWLHSLLWYAGWLAAYKIIDCLRTRRSVMSRIWWLTASAR